MPTFKIPSSESKGQQACAAGDVRLMCKGVIQKIAKNSKNPGIEWSFEIKEHSDDPFAVGRVMTRWSPITGRGSFFTRQILDALDVPYDEDEESDTLSFQGEDVIGLECAGRVEQELFQPMDPMGNPKGDPYPKNNLEITGKI